MKVLEVAADHMELGWLVSSQGMQLSTILVLSSYLKKLRAELEAVNFQQTRESGSP